MNISDNQRQYNLRKTYAQVAMRRYWFFWSITDSYAFNDFTYLEI